MGLFDKLLRSNERAERGSPSAFVVSSFDSVSNAGKSSIFKHSGMKSYILEFEIVLDDVHRVWKPNETISGTVKLRLRKDVPNVWIKLAHIGECQLHSNNPMTAGSLKSKYSDTVFCRSTSIYGSEENPLHLTGGEHKFPFSCKINGKNLVSSIDFKKGSIRYWVQAELHAQKTPPIFCKQHYQLIVPIDVGQLPKPNIKTVVLQSPNSSNNGIHVRRLMAAGSADPQDGASSLTRKTGGSSTITNGSSSSNNSGNSNASMLADNKTVKISVEIPCLGYTIGEEIPVKVHVTHYKQYFHPAGLIATLVRISRVSNPRNTEQIETFRKDICQGVAPLYTDPETHEAVIMLKLKVPLDTFPSLDLKNKFFTFQYYVEILANLSRKNLVYTESNRLVGGQRTSSIPMPSNKFSMFQDLSNQGEVTAGEGDSVTFFQDLINVDRLKRLRNVTGMSIEVVIGTHREEHEPESPTVDRLDSHSINQLPDDVDEVYNQCSSAASPIDEAYDYLLHRHNGPSPSSRIFTDTDMTLCYPADPVPLYSRGLDDFTGCSMSGVTDDKQELEQMRLKELESEPPI